MIPERAKVPKCFFYCQYALEGSVLFFLHEFITEARYHGPKKNFQKFYLAGVCPFHGTERRRRSIGSVHLSSAVHVTIVSTAAVRSC